MKNDLIVPTNPQISRDTPVLWISSCLLGEKVRYDGKDKLNRGVFTLSKVFFHHSVCPELAMGLGVPRASISWFDQALKENESQLDLTELANKTAQALISSLSRPDALILKSKSPSCGFKSVINKVNGKTHSGFFSQSVMFHYPDCKVAEETTLLSLKQIQSFASKLGASKQQLNDLQSVWNSLA